MWRQYSWVLRKGLDRDFSDDPAYQQFFVQNYVARVSNCVSPVACVVNCVSINRRMALCVTRGHFVILISSVVYLQFIHCVDKLVRFIYLLTCKDRVLILSL